MKEGDTDGEHCRNRKRNNGLYIQCSITSWSCEVLTSINEISPVTIRWQGMVVVVWAGSRPKPRSSSLLGKTAEITVSNDVSIFDGFNIIKHFRSRLSLWSPW